MWLNRYHGWRRSVQSVCVRTEKKTVRNCSLRGRQRDVDCFFVVVFKNLVEIKLKCICILSRCKGHGAHLRIVRCIYRTNGPPTLSDPLQIFAKCSLGIFHTNILEQHIYILHFSVIIILLSRNCVGWHWLFQFPEKNISR